MYPHPIITDTAVNTSQSIVYEISGDPGARTSLLTLDDESLSTYYQSLSMAEAATNTITSTVKSLASAGSPAGTGAGSINGANSTASSNLAFTGVHSWKLSFSMMFLIFTAAFL
ncbi:HFL081Cp [Eremothecium sinecaudum]|uniref:HFL081Cp n=1 Tax=Eremothecium sinecaudum TaxID=45286 RepID=A0A0X8HUL6_9SACH|nr:HFL081Cp [Eremothecium sinecaudum]AMD21775.1 HFL081Cp [Eremothecium sinecaudum]